MNFGMNHVFWRKKRLFRQTEFYLSVKWMNRFRVEKCLALISRNFCLLTLVNFQGLQNSKFEFWLNLRVQISHFHEFLIIEIFQISKLASSKQSKFNFWLKLFKPKFLILSILSPDFHRNLIPLLINSGKFLKFSKLSSISHKFFKPFQNQ